MAKRQLLGLAFLLTYLPVISAQQRSDLLVKFEQGIDQQVEQVAHYRMGAESSVFVIKKYLGSGKSTIDPKRAEYIEYVIQHGEQQVPLLQIPSGVTVEIGKIRQAEQALIIPIHYQAGHSEQYQYALSSREVNKFAPESDNASKQLAGKVIVDTAEPSTVKYYPPSKTPSAERKAESLFKVKGASLEITDTHEVGEFSFVLGTGQQQGDSFIWLVSFMPAKAKASAESVRYQMAKAGSMAASFIPSSHAQPSVHLVQRVGMQEPATDYIFDHKLNLLLEKRAARMVGDELSVVGICKDNYAVLSKKRSGKIADTLAISILDGQGKTLNQLSNKVIENGVLVNVKAVPEDDSSVLAFINFTQLEQTRRQDGWYSWDGFRVSSFVLNCTQN